MPVGGGVVLPRPAAPAGGVVPPAAGVLVPGLVGSVPVLIGGVVTLAPVPAVGNATSGPEPAAPLPLTAVAARPAAADATHAAPAAPLQLEAAESRGVAPPEEAGAHAIANNDESAAHRAPRAERGMDEGAEVG